MADVAPYLVPARDVVDFGGWTTGDEEAPLPTELSGWDPQTNLPTRQVVTVDVEKLRSDAGLSPSATFSLNVSWSSARTGMRESLARIELLPHQVVDVVLPADRLGGTVVLRTTVTLASPGGGAPGVASVPGSVLAEHRHSIALEGDAEMFPIAVADLAATSYGPYASWHLQTTTDLEAPFMGAFLLILNERDIELTSAVNSRRRSPRQDLLLEGLEAEVASLLVELASGLASEIEGATWPPDSVGAVLARYLGVANRYAVGRPGGSDDLADFRSRLNSAVRADGVGRLFS